MTQRISIEIMSTGQRSRPGVLVQLVEGGSLVVEGGMHTGEHWTPATLEDALILRDHFEAAARLFEPPPKGAKRSGNSNFQRGNKGYVPNG